ncbi:hypothetical protein ABIA95_009232, partial [Bradyrhizobium sp. LA8.1]
APLWGFWGGGGAPLPLPWRGRVDRASRAGGGVISPHGQRFGGETFTPPRLTSLTRREPTLPLQGRVTASHSFRSFTRFTHALTSASTWGSTALTSCTVMPGLMRGS